MKIPRPERERKYLALKKKHPYRIPVVIENQPGLSRQIPPLTKNRLLVGPDETIAGLLGSLRQQIQLSPAQALFLFVHSPGPQGCFLATGNDTISHLHQHHQTECGFLLMTVGGETAFGHQPPA